MLRQLSYNSLILIFSNTGTALLAFVLTLIIARGLGDVALGQYAGVMAWVLPLTLLVDFGISTLITRDVAQYPARAQAYLDTAYPIRLALGLAIIGLVTLAAPLMTNEPDGLRFAIWLVLIDSLFANYTAVFRALDHMLPILYLNIFLLAMQVGGALLVVWQGWGIVTLFGFIVGADAIQLAKTWLVWREIRPGSDEAPTSISLEWPVLLKQGQAFMVAGVLATLQLRGVVILLEQLESAQVVGWYAAASRLIEAMRMIPGAMFGAIFPTLSALIDHPAQLRRIFRYSLSVLVLYGGVMLTGVLTAGQQVIELLFGNEFSPAGGVFNILAVAFWVGLIRGLLTLWFYALHQERLVNWITALTLVVQFSVGFWLIQSMGIDGAGWVLLVGEIFSLTLMVIRRPKLLL
ncbi:MAG: oligosaccharide flippase family protein [Chloroflexi bacterium]|nr:oligosaccharide flippase family protein [Chloroflexota bacterium]